MATGWAPPAGPVTLVLNKLDGIRRSGSGWTGRCPAHEDRQASLSVTEGDDGRALVYCHAGCTVEAVTDGLGIRPADLFTERNGNRAPTHTRSTHVEPERPPTLYAIRDTDGEPVAVHVRTETPTGKRMTWRLPDGTSGLNGTASKDLPLFGSEHLAKWDTSRPVIVAEGEKAAIALLTAGFRALGTVTGAATAPSVAVPQALRGHHVILWPDNDDAGRKHMRTVAEELVGIAATVRLLSWPEAPVHGDAADLLATGAATDVDALLATAAPLTRPGPVGIGAARALAAVVGWPRVPRQAAPARGDPDLGKTTATLDLAARVSRGAPMPDGSPGIDPAGVVIMGAEDGLADTVPASRPPRPRCGPRCARCRHARRSS